MPHLGQRPPATGRLRDPTVSLPAAWSLVCSPAGRAIRAAQAAVTLLALAGVTAEVAARALAAGAPAGPLLTQLGHQIADHARARAAAPFTGGRPGGAMTPLEDAGRAGRARSG
jgi:hypothetical protein